MTPVRNRYQTIEFDKTDIHLRTLRDNQQYFDKDNIAENLGISSATWPLFGIVWPSSIVLANYMMTYDFADKRILEIGCGIGLASLLLNDKHADISATDMHPEAEQYLIENTTLNKGKTIPYERASWDNCATTLGKFDLIIGSDVLYERQNIDYLATFIDNHTKESSSIIIVDPGRGNHAAFSKLMVKLGYSHNQDNTGDTSYLDKPYNGQILQYQRYATAA